VFVSPVVNVTVEVLGGADAVSPLSLGRCDCNLEFHDSWSALTDTDCLNSKSYRVVMEAVLYDTGRFSSFSGSGSVVGYVL
jgi:hypothetical protein